jgi:ketosteroid isomerase-like protein
MSVRVIVAFLALSVLVAAAPAARADAASDKAAIIERLRRWTDAFNAKDAPGVCDLFSPDLIYSVPEKLDGTRTFLCGRLAKLLADPALQLRYDQPEIHEVIVSGGLPVVRLTWTLAARSGSIADTTQEPGIDIFQRQPDGRWSIARFIAFTTRPNKSTAIAAAAAPHSLPDQLLTKSSAVCVTFCFLSAITCQNWGQIRSGYRNRRQEGFATWVHVIEPRRKEPRILLGRDCLVGQLSRRGLHGVQIHGVHLQRGIFRLVYYSLGTRLELLPGLPGCPRLLSLSACLGAATCEDQSERDAAAPKAKFPMHGRSPV